MGLKLVSSTTLLIDIVFLDTSFKSKGINVCTPGIPDGLSGYFCFFSESVCGAWSDPIISISLFLRAFLSLF